MEKNLDPLEYWLSRAMKTSVVPWKGIGQFQGPNAIKPVHFLLLYPLFNLLFQKVVNKKDSIKSHFLPLFNSYHISIVNHV